MWCAWYIRLLIGFRARLNITVSNVAQWKSLKTLSFIYLLTYLLTYLLLNIRSVYRMTLTNILQITCRQNICIQFSYQRFISSKLLVVFFAGRSSLEVRCVLEDRFAPDPDQVGTVIARSVGVGDQLRIISARYCRKSIDAYCTYRGNRSQVYWVNVKLSK